jgi:DNA (cytosine-5)-methyltransferase 1
VLNAKDYGMAQNRERVFAVSVIGGVKKDLKPTPIKLEKALINYLDTVVDDKYYCKYENTSCLNMIAKGTFGATGVINTKPICLNSKGGRNGIEGLQPSVKDRIYDSNAIAPCVTTSEFFMPKFTHQIDVFEPIAYDEQNQYLRKDGCVGTLTTDGHSPKHNNRILNINGAIRKLTPKECWRLMGFSDSDFNTAKQALNDKFYKGKDRSNSQLYKQAGNSIVTNCLIAIFHSLFIENTTDYERYLIDYDK